MKKKRGRRRKGALVRGDIEKGHAKNKFTKKGGETRLCKKASFTELQTTTKAAEG